MGREAAAATGRGGARAPVEGPAPRSLVATFDLEDWFHAENVRASLPTSDWDSLEPRLERNAHALLDLLAEVGGRATFFVLGWVARRYPSVVARIVAEGHEVASHTDLHRRLDLLPPAEVVRDLARARDSLEQLTGTPVLGVRAPNFSISDEVLDLLAEAGYRYDSSYFPFAAHDRYGRISAPVERSAPIVEVRPGLLELPMSCLPLGPVSAPWSGGAYFRLIPYPVFRRGVAAVLRRSSWFMFYLHPWELDPEEVPPPGMPRSLRVRAYAGRARVARDLRRLLREFGCSRVDEALRARGYLPPAARAAGPLTGRRPGT
ncbi:MAG TPA: polysaccharide deacetylase family protein [Actinomycetota bacterium]|nr:polysaccharide deacetylase family protein [Actinomycetota bacterium]